MLSELLTMYVIVYKFKNYTVVKIVLKLNYNAYLSNCIYCRSSQVACVQRTLSVHIHLCGDTSLHKQLKTRQWAILLISY